MLKRIVCLANSLKHGGRCIAGRELLEGGPGRWIRPVSDRPGEEVSEPERQYQNGEEPCLLDIISVPLVGLRSRLGQPENWLLDRKYYWAKVGEFRYGDLNSVVETNEALWVNGYHTSTGLNNCMPEDVFYTAGSSLKLIAVSSMQLQVFTTGETFGNPKRIAQAKFAFNGEEYDLRVTDPVVRRKYFAECNGRYDLGPRYLTISLSIPWQGSSYKLVAAIIGEAP